jgi:hypothetical protein
MAFAVLEISASDRSRRALISASPVGGYCIPAVVEGDLSIGLDVKRINLERCIIQYAKEIPLHIQATSGPHSR